MSSNTNSKLSKIKAQINSIQSKAGQEMNELKAEAAKLILKKAEAKIKKVVSDVESSTDLTSRMNDEWLCQWKKVDFSEMIDTKDELQMEILAQHFSDEFHVECDFKNDMVLMSIGPAILIYDNGDVHDQDSGKRILSKGDYESATERNELIEKHMEKTGCFPAVVNYDYNGNAFYVNTKK